MQRENDVLVMSKCLFSRFPLLSQATVVPFIIVRARHGANALVVSVLPQLRPIMLLGPRNDSINMAAPRPAL